MIGKPADSDSVLSNCQKAESGKAYWVEVQPIEWLKDTSGVWVSKKCLFAGIQFDTQEEYDGDFSKTSMKKYLDTYFSQEMISENVFTQEDKTKITQQIKEMDVATIQKLPQENPNLLRNLIIVAGLLEEKFKEFSYEQQKALYGKIYNHTNLSPKQKKEMEKTLLEAQQAR